LASGVVLEDLDGGEVSLVELPDAQGEEDDADDFPLLTNVNSVL
jgi:hypothetical protein